MLSEGKVICYQLEFGCRRLNWMLQSSLGRKFDTFGWMLQSSSGQKFETFTLMMTGAFGRNIGKLFSKLKLVTDNLLFIYAEANWEATEMKNMLYLGTDVVWCPPAWVLLPAGFCTVKFTKASASSKRVWSEKLWTTYQRLWGSFLEYDMIIPNLGTLTGSSSKLFVIRRGTRGLGLFSYWIWAPQVVWEVFAGPCEHKHLFLDLRVSLFCKRQQSRVVCKQVSWLHPSAYALETLWHEASAEMTVSQVESNSARTGTMVRGPSFWHAPQPYIVLSEEFSKWFSLLGKIRWKFTKLIHHAEKSVDVTDILGYRHLLGRLDFGWIWVDLSTIWPRSLTCFWEIPSMFERIFTPLCWV